MKRPKTLKRQLIAQFYRGNIPAFCAAIAIMIPLGLMNVVLSWIIQEMMDGITGVPGALDFTAILAVAAALIVGATVLLLLRREVEPRFIRRALRQFLRPAAPSSPRMRRRSAAYRGRSGD